MAERIEIEDRRVGLLNGAAEALWAPLKAWLQAVSGLCLQGLTKEPLPDRTLWHVVCGPVEVLILQLEPALRSIQWIAPDSPAPYGLEATSLPRKLATPYVIIKVPFRRRRVVHRVEVFYRNEPLREVSGPGGELFWPNLLNVSPNAHGCHSWFCTQFLDQAEKPYGLGGGSNAVVHHLWGGQFNFSSEAHEGKSAFSLAGEMLADERVTNVDRWEAESDRDPRFVLSVNWASTGLDVEKLVLAEFAAQGVPLVPDSVSALAHHVLRLQRQSAGEPDES